MGVLACDRSGCENVMCDRYSHEHGYICNECYDELITAIYKMDIDTFMRTDKDGATEPAAVLQDEISTFEWSG